jgi:hypothetical protein
MAIRARYRLDLLAFQLALFLCLILSQTLSLIQSLTLSLIQSLTLAASINLVDYSPLPFYIYLLHLPNTQMRTLLECQHPNHFLDMQRLKIHSTHLHYSSNQFLAVNCPLLNSLKQFRANLLPRCIHSTWVISS